MLTGIINLGDSFATSTLGIAGSIVSDLSPYLGLILGVLLAVIVIAFLVKSLIRH